MPTNWTQIWYNAAPLVVSALGYAVTALSPYANSAGLVGIAVLVVDELYYIAKQYSTSLPAPNPAPQDTPSMDWPVFLLLNGAPNTSPTKTVVATSVNPESKKTWYAVVDNTSHVALTAIKPS